jgi:hypothetical protein
LTKSWNSLILLRRKKGEIIFMRPIIAQLTFPDTGRSLMRVVPSTEREGVFDVIVANPHSVVKEGKNYGWTDARDVTGVTREQLAQLIATSGEIFNYDMLTKDITPAQEVLLTVT